MNKQERDNEKKMRDEKDSGLKPVPHGTGKATPWADHRPVDPGHLKEDKR